MRLVHWGVFLSFLAMPGIAGAGDKKGSPRLSLTAVPRVAAAPIEVLFTAELTGGDDGETLYCPSLEWDWGDGTRASQGGDCPPFREGETEVQRLFEGQHEYRKEGRPTVHLRILKEGKVIARAEVGLVVGRPNQGPKMEYREVPRQAGESRSHTPAPLP